MNNILYIDTPEKLDELCERITHEPWIALDTEFIREKSYYPRFCLLQIATIEWVACIDPLALSDLDKLFQAVYNPALIKVFHSCRQDLEIFYHLTGEVPEPIFDTQIAAPLLGFQENPGYGMLVSSFLNINLSKDHTRADWSERPLSEAQLQYAADDVIYLAQIYLLITQKLLELGRLDWLHEDFSQLINKDLYLQPVEKAWLKIKGNNRLTGVQLSIVQVLAEWRENAARSEDRPRNWLVRDDLILELAKLQPETVSALFKIRNLNPRTVKQYGDKLCRLITQAKSRTPSKRDERWRAPKKNQQQEAVLDVLSAVVRIRAEENSLNPAVLATRKDLEMLLFDNADCSLLHGWRYSMAGEELQGLLQSRNTLTLQAGTIRISEGTS